MRRRRSLTQVVIDNLIYRVTSRKSPNSSATQLDIQPFSYIDHLAYMKRSRLRIRRKSD